MRADNTYNNNIQNNVSSYDRQMTASITQYPMQMQMTVQQEANNLRQYGYFADVLTKSDEKKSVYEDELVESIDQKMIYILKHSEKAIQRVDLLRVKTNNSKYQSQLRIVRSAQKAPKVKNNNLQKPFAYFLITEAIKVYCVTNKNLKPEKYDILLKCDSMNGRFEVLIPYDDFINKKISKCIEKAVMFAPFTTSLSKGSINSYLYKHITHDLCPPPLRRRSS